MTVWCDSTEEKQKPRSESFGPGFLLAAGGTTYVLRQGIQSVSCTSKCAVRLRPST